MKGNLFLSLAVISLGFNLVTTDSVAQPDPPYAGGAISFSGIPQPNGPLNTATAFTNFISVTVAGGGESGVYTNIPAGHAASWKPFTFNPPAGAITRLWALTNNGVVYSYDATSVSVAYQSSNFVDVAGTGVAHATGYADVPGTWAIAVSQTMSLFTFSASANASATNIPLLQNVKETNGLITFTWNTLPDQAYQLQYRTNLLQPDWINLGSAVVASNSVIPASDPVGPDQTRFYRVILAP